ncbi:MAG TPA: MFS transporter [Solirubrobacteraceae bacterium]|nr:MFS transporter [Solirubrobacteraceae bacterium]
MTQREALQRRTLRVLVAAQVLSGLGGSGAAAGALLALGITGSDALASLPLALLVVGSASTVVPISALSRRAGRRTGLATALAIATVGAVGVVVAGELDSFALLLAASLLFGAGNTAVMLARYAAVDLSTPDERGRAIGRVVFATTFGAVAGPNLLEPAGSVATSLGLPELTGLFLTSIAAFALAGLVLTVFLRPDPLKVAAGFEEAPGPLEERAAAAPPVPLRELLSPSAAVTGLTTVVVANFVMVAVMAMAPVHMQHHGHGLQFVGLVISLHIAGMFAPSPVTGWLTDRLGPLAVAGGGAALLIVAGVLSAASGAEASTFALGLGLLGVGWNASLIAGSALLASAVPVAQRPRVEGAGELSMGVAAASATAIAGPVVGIAGYAALAAAGAVAAATLAPFLVAVARRGLPADVVPATRVLG